MRLSTVCRRWKQLLYLGSNLCNVLDLKPYNRDLDDKGLIQITNFVGSRPTVIDITNCYHISDESFSYLINEVGIKGCIKKLYMKNNWNISAMAIMDLAVPSVGHDLVLLDISNCRKVKDDVVERLIGWKDPDVVAMGMLESNNYNLAPYLQNQYRYLHEQNQMLKMNQFKNNAIGCPKLAYLNLSYCKYLTDKTMIHLSQHANDRLVSLNLTRCTTITDNGFSFWATTHFKNLKNLVLRDCTFLSDNAITSIAGSCPNLEVLDLTFCCVLTDNSLSILYLCCKKLKELNLSFCGSAVSNHSLASISRLPQLWKLIITGCVRVTRQGVDVLLATSQSITHLDLSQCPRVHMFQGTPVEPFERKPGTRNAYLKVAPHDRIVKVVL
ncbi:unnamed protein product [[Candida] boidinii]|nr:unnamed protein product [[Candida] boidinii]